MSEQWLSIAAAAAHLNCHPRTIERRIAAGKIQTRRVDDGAFGQQMQVLINLPDAPEPQPAPQAAPQGSATNSQDFAPEAFETVRELAQDQVSLATGSASALVKFAQDDAMRARDELTLARIEVARTRRDSKLAWSAVALMACAVCAAVGWTTHRITKTDEQLRSLNDTTAAIRAEARQLLTERDSARQAAESAKLSEAQVSGKLSVMTDQVSVMSDQVRQLSAKRPATQPSSFIQRLFANTPQD
jgi:hypothetical protein